jgi:dTDP-4-dehydrorhamnose reductase
MKILVLGASGIIGQHMRLCCPEGVTPIYARRKSDLLHVGVDVLSADVQRFLDYERPDVIVNLAGESNTDAVERDPSMRTVNTLVPELLGEWCQRNKRHLVHVSTQAVFSGENPPYGPSSPMDPVNEYGRQKSAAEVGVRASKCSYTIVRPTFVLGIRPIKTGRANPLEQILAGQNTQVADRWFSISLAREVAQAIWKCAVERPGGIIHVGEGKISRYELAYCIARSFGSKAPMAVDHESFSGLAPRPKDTSYSTESGEILKRLIMNIKADQDELTIRAREIALFLGKREDECLARLHQGWGAIHGAVTDDWNKANPSTDAEILDWYRRTETYIWELSWYHADPGFNYAGMVRGIIDRLKAAGVGRVLCLGDGIGTATMMMRAAGIDATYHDLEGSRTAEFAQFRAWRKTGEHMPERLSKGWEPDLGAKKWDAIVSLDFLEHVTDVEAWATAIRDALRPGGLLVAQNAFGIGSDGSMPMHLTRNDRFEKDWDPLLSELGFVQESSNWYRVPE